METLDQVTEPDRDRPRRSGLSDSAIYQDFSGSPNGIRTRVSTLRGWCPRPLDDGAIHRGRSRRILPVHGIG